MASLGIWGLGEDGCTARLSWDWLVHVTSAAWQSREVSVPTWRLDTPGTRAPTGLGRDTSKASHE